MYSCSAVYSCRHVYLLTVCSIQLPVCLSACPSLPFLFSSCLSISLSLTLSLPLFSLSVYLPVPLFPSSSLPVCLSACPSLPLPLLSLPISLSLTPSLPLFSLSVYLPVPPFLFLFSCPSPLCPSICPTSTSHHQ